MVARVVDAAVLAGTVLLVVDVDEHLARLQRHATHRPSRFACSDAARRMASTSTSEWLSFQSANRGVVIAKWSATNCMASVSKMVGSTPSTTAMAPRAQHGSPAVYGASKDSPSGQK